MNSTLSHVFAAALVVAVGLSVAFPAHAQQPVEEYASGDPSNDQVRLNQSAVEAILAKDYQKATGLLEASLELGELNVTYLNLGRAYQKLGECKKARKAYLGVLTAPAVEEPPQKLIDAKAEQYLDELDSECKTELVEAGDSSQTGDKDAVVAPTVASAESSNVLGWSATIGGGVLLATSGALYLAGRAQHQRVELAHAESQLAADGSVTDITRQEALNRRERGDLFKTLAVSTAIVGVATTGAGVYWLSSDDDQSDTQVSLGAGVSSWTVRLSTRF